MTDSLLYSKVYFVELTLIYIPSIMIALESLLAVFLTVTNFKG